MSSPGAKASARGQGLESLRVQLRFPTPGCYRATGTESEPLLYPTESCESSCAFVVWLVVQNVAPKGEYPLDVLAREEHGWEKHSLDNRGRCEIASRGS